MFSKTSGKLGNQDLNVSESSFFHPGTLNFDRIEKLYMIRLIIVDDHYHVREAWSWVLGQVPNIHVISLCSNGEEAIEAARSLQPDIMLMDIHMSPVNGMEATRAIRQFAPQIKVIAVSVQADRSYVNEMLRSGAQGYVTKNSSCAEMVTAIDEVLAGNLYLCEELGHLRHQIQWTKGDQAPAITFSALKASRGFNPSNSNIL
jgi:two-component system invasion response regulator UvrY